MDAKRSSCNLTKYVKVGANRWQYCPVVRGKTGRVKQDLVLVNDRREHHPEGYYALDWREDGKRRRVAVGKNAASAQQEQERHQVLLQARAVGLAVAAERPLWMSPTIEESCEEFLAEIRVQRSPKTFQQYRTALAYFQESSGQRPLSQVDRRTLLDFHRFLAQEKRLASRTISTKTMVVVQMLKANGITGLLRRGDWPRYVERIPRPTRRSSCSGFSRRATKPIHRSSSFFWDPAFEKRRCSSSPGGTWG